MTTKKLLKIIAELEKNYDFNDSLENYIDEEDLQEAIANDSVQEYLQDLDQDGDITETDVIYYSNAIKYLSENDPSLRESIELASNMGYDVDKVNSELLASLLKSQNNKNDYSTFIGEVIEAIDN